MKRFPEKRVFITGAGSGLGRAVSLEFAKLGWRVGVAEINPEGAAETVKLVNEAGGQGLLIPCDVTKEDDIKRSAELVVKEWGGVDIVINNAGVSVSGYMEEIPLDRWDWILNINLKSVVMGCREFIPILEKQGKGHIVNTASYMGFISAPRGSSYNVTKAGVISLSETILIEFIKKGIDIGVTVIMPSFFKTNLLDQQYAVDDIANELAINLFEKTSCTPEKVARRVMKGIKKNKLYVLPQLDAKILWAFKRWFPRLYIKIFSSVNKMGLVEKYAGIDV